MSIQHPRRHATFWRLSLVLASVTLGLITIAPAASAADIPVETEADYQSLLDAVRATEYTRQQYLETIPNTRAIAGVAGLWAFAERNPLATPEQLSAFIVSYDDALAQRIPGDPTLARTGSLMTALTAATVEPTGELAGTDTRIGARAMALLGIDLPGLDGYQESRQRMARFDFASIQRLINRTETADALTGVLAGVDPSGRRVAGLTQAGSMYLESLGFAPMLGQIDPAQIEVNNGLAGLPTFGEFLTIRDTDGAHLTLESEVFAGINAVQADAAAILAAIGTVQTDPSLALNSIALFAAAADPNAPGHAAALAQLQARRQAVIDSIRNTSDERAAIFARTLLLQQSSYPDVERVATIARSFAGLQLQSNNGLAVAQQSSGLLGSLAGIGAAYATGDIWGGVQSLTNLVAGAFGLADILGADAPGPDEQIFDQIVELRQQVEDLRVQMNARFDVVDAKLDTIFSTMIAGFGAIGDQIGDLQNDVDDLTAAIAETRTTLDRIEAALFGFAEDALLLPLSLQTDLVLDYRADTGADLPYANQTPSFINGSSFFFTYATNTAGSTVFAGPTSQQLTLENARSTLDSGPVARALNDLRRIPVGLFTSAGEPVVGPITPSRVVAPAPWSQAAAAYTQLARENPWYFAYMLRNQQAGGNTEINQIIAEGARIAALADATRDRADLFDALLARAGDDAFIAGVIIDDTISNAMVAAGYANATTQLDPWGPLGQPVSGLVPSVNSFSLTDGVGFLAVTAINSGQPHRGFEMAVASNIVGPASGFTRAQISELLAMTDLLRAPPQTRQLTLFVPFDDLTPTTRDFNAWLIDQGTHWPSRRDIRFRTEIFRGGQWVALNLPFLDGPSCFQAMSTIMPALKNQLAATGNLGGISFPLGLWVFTTTSFPGIAFHDARLRVLTDTSTMTVNGVDHFGAAVGFVADRLSALRTDVRDDVIADLQQPASSIGMTGARLDNISSLLDAYLTLGMADAMTQSEALRSALRGVPSIGGLGFRSDDILTLVLADDQRDDGSVTGGPGVVLPRIDDHLLERIDAIRSEIDAALGTDAPSFPYVEFVLADLRNLRDTAFRLAIDDTYAATGPVEVDQSNGLLANDIGQPGRIDGQELMVDLSFFANPAHTPPAHGQVTVNPDGSFLYTPDPDFVGTDSFNYRLSARVDDSPNPVGDPVVVSTPATVVIRVGPTTCPADFTGDGQLNFFDFAAFVAAFQAQDPAADFNNDGLLNFFDFPAFINAFDAGCP